VAEAIGRVRRWQFNGKPFQKRFAFFKRQPRMAKNYDCGGLCVYYRVCALQRISENVLVIVVKSEKDRNGRSVAFCIATDPLRSGDESDVQQT
jgi:hypothetical protein